MADGIERAIGHDCEKHHDRNPWKAIFCGSCVFCSLSLITRTIGPEQFGIYMLAFSFVEIIGNSMLFGLDTAMIRFVPITWQKTNLVT